MSMDIAVYDSAGSRTWLSQIADVADVEFSTRWGTGGSGCYEASWSMNLGPNATPPMLLPGRRVEIYDGAGLVWTGKLTEPERGAPWRLHAFGLALQAGNYLCQASGGGTTSVPNTAVDQAIIRGLPWVRYASMSTTAFSAASTTVALNTVDTLLDAWAQSAGVRWAVFENGILTATADPTTPTWMLVRGAPSMGVADDEYVSHLTGTYVSAVTGTPPVPTAWSTVTVGSTPASDRWGRSERSLDLTKLGLMTSDGATALTQARFNRVGARMGFTTPITASADDLCHINGGPARLSQIRAGDMLRIYRVLDAGGNLALGTTVDVVLGEVRYSGEDSIYLAPVGLLPRGFSDALEAPAPPEKEFIA